jgi:hypothetical protein
MRLSMPIAMLMYTQTMQPWVRAILSNAKDTYLLQLIHQMYAMPFNFQQLQHFLVLDDG